MSTFFYSYGKRISISTDGIIREKLSIKFTGTTCIFTQRLLSINGSYDKDIFCVWLIESNSLQADVGKIHITALKLLVPVGEVILT